MTTATTKTAADVATLAKQHLATGDLSRFVPVRQRAALAKLLRDSEEREWFATTLCALADRIAAMPKTYETDGQGEAAVVHLHYFSTVGAANWWITEKDADGTGTQQAFGKADLHGEGDGGEMGYVCIWDLMQGNAVELDLHWTPKPLRECR